MKPFTALSKEHAEKTIVLRDEIYRMLLTELHGDPHKNDLILNACLGALVGHIITNVDKDNWPIMIQLVYKIVCDNLPAGDANV